MKTNILFSTFLLLLLSGLVKAQKTFDIEGHRGCRGLMPENTIPAMIKALDLGVNTLELDVVISRDKQVVVSHDPFMNIAFSASPDGRQLTKEDEESFILYKMDYMEIKKWDVGSMGNPKFPRQQKIAAYKPLLSALIDSVEKYVQQNNMPLPKYNIEIKSTVKGDGIYTPEPEEFVRLVMDVVKNKGIEQRLVLQSFDLRPLVILHNSYPEICLSYLIENVNSIGKNIRNLGFVPDIYSPYYKLIRQSTIKKAHGKGIKIVPWTVNDTETMIKLINLGVDGIISDYPDYFNDLKVQAALKGGI